MQPWDRSCAHSSLGRFVKSAERDWGRTRMTLREFNQKVVVVELGILAAFCGCVGVLGIWTWLITQQRLDEPLLKSRHGQVLLPGNFPSGWRWFRPHVGNVVLRGVGPGTDA